MRVSGHFHAPLFISFVIIHKEQTGRYENDVTAHGYPGCAPSCSRDSGALRRSLVAVSHPYPEPDSLMPAQIVALFPWHLPCLHLLGHRCHPLVTRYLRVRKWDIFGFPRIPWMKLST